MTDITDYLKDYSEEDWGLIPPNIRMRLYATGEYSTYEEDFIDAAEEIERLRGALMTIDSLIPKTREITDFPHWAAIAGDIAESALNGTWPAYGVMPVSAKEKQDDY